MLTEKDYCDLKTTKELESLGMNVYTSFNGVDVLRNVLLYEAQKWLREEKRIYVEANFDLMYKGHPRFSWRVLYNLTQHEGAYYTFDSVKSKEDYDSFEESLSEGIKEAVKILKDQNNGRI